MKTPPRPPGKPARAPSAPAGPSPSKTRAPAGKRAATVPTDKKERTIPVIRDEVVPANAGRAARRTPQERQRLIARGAYFRSESRGFAPGHEVEDWLWAERQVDEDLAAESAPAGERNQ